MKKIETKQFIGWLILASLHVTGIFLISIQFLVGSATTNESIYSLTELEIYLRRILFVLIIGIVVSAIGTLVVRMFHLQVHQKVSKIFLAQVFVIASVYLTIEIFVSLFSML